MKCPVCTTSDLLMSDRQGVEIDYCPQCRGVWLDRGELDKIIERSSVPPRQPSSQGQYSKDEHDHGDKHKKYSEGHRHKKKSLLKELFDF